MPYAPRWLWTCSLVAALTPAAAAAQSPGEFYAGAAYTAFRLDTDDIDGTVSGVDFMVGAGVLPWMSAEFQLLLPGETFSRSFTAKSRSFAPPGTPREDLERFTITERFLRERDPKLSPAVAVVFHPSEQYRVTPAFIAGVTWHHHVHRETIQVVEIPPDVDPDRVQNRVRVFEEGRWPSYPTIGVRVAVGVIGGLVVTPEVRLDYASIGDQIDHTVRSSIRVEWRF